MKIQFQNLTEAQRVEARNRIANVLDQMARDTGKVCMNTSDEVAPKCKYRMSRGHIWGIEFPKDLVWFK